MMLYNQKTKSKANALLNQAIKKGLIIRPTVCSKCGSNNKGKKIQGHHPDYFRPLEVVWLCSKCHRRLHPGEVQALPMLIRLKINKIMYDDLVVDIDEAKRQRLAKYNNLNYYR